MISIPPGLLGRDFDLGAVRITPEMIGSYADVVGDRAALEGPMREAPPTFCLFLHRGMRPEVELPPDFFGVYGGHDIELHQPLRAGESYHLHARLADVYEKSGRSGALTVIVREARIEDAAGQIAVCITERQIVRARPGESRQSTVDSRETTTEPSDDSTAQRPNHPTIQPRQGDEGTSQRGNDVGDEIGPVHRDGPSAAQTSAYVGATGAREGLFTRPEHARELGFRGLVVPGPMLSAFIEQFLRGQLPDWRIERLSVTFRMPTITSEPLILRGAITERHEMADGVRVVCDVVIEHADGERGVTGTATLRQAAPR